MLERLELRRFRDEDGDELLDLPGAPLPDPDTPGAAALPADLGRDACSSTRAARGILPEEHRPKIFHTKTPQSFPTFLVDGAVAGTWRHAGGAIVLDPFAPLAADDEAALRAEAVGLAALHA